MKRFWNSHLLLAVGRLALLYGILMLCRAIFWCVNRELLGEVEAWWPLLCGALQFDTVSVLYAQGLWLVLALLPLPLAVRESRLYQRLLFGLYAVVGAVMVVLNLSDVVYFNYTQKRLTADELFFADNSNSLQLILKFAAESWWLVLLGLGLIALLAWGYGHKREPRAPYRKWYVYYPLSLLTLALVGGLSVGGIRGGFTRMTRPITLSNATLYTPSPVQANLILSNPFCILRTASSNSKIVVPNHFSQEEADRLFSPAHYPTERPDTLGLHGRNVVIFICESMSAEHSDHLRPDLYSERGKEGYTPFLDSLMREGFCFRQMYANGMRSIQGMPSVLGSIPSLKTPFVLMPQSLGESRQLPRILRDKGYESAFFCGSESGSMGFGAYARSAGIEHLYAREDYEARHGTADFDGYWGIWDDKFLSFMGEEISNFREPFFATLFTLTAHHPFVVPDELKGVLPEGESPIHRPAAYDDWAFRQFFERYRDAEWMKRTLFVFVADHVSSERYSDEACRWPGDHHIIGLLYAPGSKLQGEYLLPASQIDLMPTILGLLGNTEPYFAFGRDLFAEPERPAWAVSYENGFQVVTPEGYAHYGADALPDDETGRLLKAFEQQYYRHIADKSYLVR